MPTVTLTLEDTPQGGVSIHSSFKPAVGNPVTPAQSHALEIINRTHKQWGLPTSNPFCQCGRKHQWADIDSGKCLQCGKKPV